VVARALEIFLDLKSKYFQRFPENKRKRVDAYIEQCKK
jgi:hypothetical protein